MYKVCETNAVLVLNLELVVIGKEAGKKERLCCIWRMRELIYQLQTVSMNLALAHIRAHENAYLHESWEEVPVDKIRHQDGLISSRDHRESCSNGFLSDFIWDFRKPRSGQCISDVLTASTIFDTVIERYYELGKDSIDIVQSSQDFDDI